MIAYLTFDLSHITQASYTESVVLPLQCPSNAAPHAGLTHPRGAHQAQDLAMGATPKPPNSNELQDSVFHIFQAIVVLI